MLARHLDAGVSLPVLVVRHVPVILLESFVLEETVGETQHVDAESRAPERVPCLSVRQDSEVATIILFGGRKDPLVDMRRVAKWGEGSQFRRRRMSLGGPEGRSLE